MFFWKTPVRYCSFCDVKQRIKGKTETVKGKIDVKKLLITGVSGFVGHHFIDYLYNEGIETEICGIDLREPAYDLTKYKDRLLIDFRQVDLLDIESIREVFRKFVPDYILHLASFSSVAYSWQHPAESFVNNTNLFLNLLTVVGEFNKECRVLSVGSSEEYGNVTLEEVPIKEKLALKPTSPYAIARVSQEMLAKLYVDFFGYNIVMTRSFNHIGPWQDERFVVPSFIKRIREIKESGLAEGVIETGNISVVRDFIDVRDVVKAYYILLTKAKAGSIYNICSGECITLSGLIDRIADMFGVNVKTKVNPDYVRPNDNSVTIGENFKIKHDFGWIPRIPLEKTLSDMIEESTPNDK